MANYSITLSDVQPSPRFAEPPAVATAWTTVRFEFAATRGGPWTEAETQPLDPIDTDPGVPLERDLTFELPSPAYPGWVRAVFKDAAGTEEPTDPLFVGSALRPTVQEVANLMPDRTTLTDGTEAGTFTTDTRPTSTQVDSLIDTVLDAIDPRIGEDSEKQRAARMIITLEAAILTELTYFSDQGTVNTSRIEAWERLVQQHTTAILGGTDTAGSTTTLKAGSMIYDPSTGLVTKRIESLLP